VFPMNVVTCQTYLSRPSVNRADILVVVIHEVMTTILPFLNQAQKTAWTLEFTGAVVWNSTPIEIRKS
jgi:hypothetical protein